MTIRLLIVDDYPQIRELLADYFGDLPDRFTVVGTAADGAAALHAVMATDPDAVLMDIVMPGLDGIAATRAIRKDHPGVAVITYTSHTDTQYAELARAAGAATHLCKPFDFGLLQAQVSAAVAAQQQPGGDSI